MRLDRRQPPGKRQRRQQDERTRTLRHLLFDRKPAGAFTFPRSYGGLRPR
jgi:hypothetical protein